MKTYKAQALSTMKYGLGESPAYDVRNGRCSFVDITAGKLYIFSEADINNLDNMECIDFGQMIGAAVPLRSGEGYLVAGTDALFTCKGKEILKGPDLTGLYETYQRSNDAKADPKGRLWFGSSVGVDGHEPSGNLYRLDD